MSKIYDLQQLEELAGGSDEFVMSMVDTFLEHTPGQLQELKGAYENGDLTAMGGVAHKIKPNIDLFGISILNETIRSIEQKGKSGNADDALKDEIALLDENLNLAFTQLKELR